MWQGDFALAVDRYGADKQLDPDDLLLAPFRLSGTLYANYLANRHDDNAELLNHDQVAACRRHWFEYAERGAQNVLGVAVALAGLNNTQEAWGLIERTHSELGAVRWPPMPGDFLLGLAAVHLADGNNRERQTFSTGSPLAAIPNHTPSAITYWLEYRTGRQHNGLNGQPPN